MTYGVSLEAMRLLFPQLTAANSRLTSPFDEGYNCIAWAAADTERWWWPDPQEQKYWPEKLPRVVTIDAFVKAYGLLGYLHKTDASLEPGRQKIAIFADEGGTPTHASRQLSDGWWTSKLGKQVDIEHELSALEGSTYGKVAIVLGRTAKST